MLSVLLVLYILATVLCLRSVRHKRGLYAVAGSKEGGQDGQLYSGGYTEYRGLPQAESQHQLAPSDTGSRDTEQESLTVRFYCEAQARVRQGSARDGSQGERPQSLNPCLELTVKLVATPK